MAYKKPINPIVDIRGDMITDLLTMTEDFGETEPLVVAYKTALYWTNEEALIDVCYTGEKSAYFHPEYATERMAHTMGANPIAIVPRDC